MQVSRLAVLSEIYELGLDNHLYINKLTDNKYKPNQEAIEKLYRLLQQYKKFVKRTRSKPYILSNSKELNSTLKNLQRATNIKKEIIRVINYEL